VTEEEQNFEAGKDENLKNESVQESEGEWVKETGVLVYHAATGLRCEIKAKVRQGDGKVFVNGLPISELMKEGKILRAEELMQVMSRERLKRLDIDLDVGDVISKDVLSPPVLTYALIEALTNLLGRL